MFNRNPKCANVLFSVRGLVALILPVAVALFLPAQVWGQGNSTIDLDDVTAQTAIDFQHTDGSSGRRYVIEPLTAGLALFDYDNDGLIDIYFLNGCPLPGSDTSQIVTNRLFRNQGNWRFQDVTQQAGVGDPGYGMGVAAGDYDNDGDWDLYISNFGPDIFYVNNGDGSFTQQQKRALLDDGSRFGAGVCFFDIDGDALLDIYIANYQKFKFEDHFEQKIGNYPIHPGPRDFPPEDDLLFRNRGDGTFEDVSESSGIRVSQATGMGVISADFDGNGTQDIFVGNDTYPNFLFLNNGKGVFTDEAIALGIATDRFGKANGNMGVDCGDIDRDGRLDNLTTTYQGEMPVLYRQVAPGLYEDTTNRCRIDPGLLPHVNWGVSLIDFDNDADKDIFIANGHFIDNIKFLDDRTSVKIRNEVLANDGKGKFTNVSERAGTGLKQVESSRGAAFDDLDNDGWIDAVIMNWNSSAQILFNRGGQLRENGRHRWLEVELFGVESNRSAAGAIVRVKSTGGEQMGCVHLGRGYQSHYGTRIHFGFGAEIAQDLEVIWPSGKRQTFPIAQTNCRIAIVEGQSFFSVFVP